MSSDCSNCLFFLQLQRIAAGAQHGIGTPAGPGLSMHYTSTVSTEG